MTTPAAPKSSTSALIEQEVPFEEVLGNAELKEVFRKYVSQRKKDEQLLFIDQVLLYEKASDDIVKRTNIAKYIVDNFVTTGSKYEVNISDEQRTKFLTNWKSKAKFGTSGMKAICADDKLFDRLRTECAVQLKYECYNEFIRSPVLEDYLKHKEKQMQAKKNGKLKRLESSSNIAKDNSGSASGSNSVAQSPRAKQDSPSSHDDATVMRNQYRRKTIHLQSSNNNSPSHNPFAAAVQQQSAAAPHVEYSESPHPSTPLHSMATSLPATPQSYFAASPSPQHSNPLQDKMHNEPQEMSPDDPMFNRRRSRSNSISSSEQMKRRSGMRLSQSSNRDSVKPDSIISDILSKLDEKDPENWDHADGASYMNNISLEEYKQRYTSSMDNTQLVGGSALEALFEECEITFNAKRLRNILKHEKEEESMQIMKQQLLQQQLQQQQQQEQESPISSASVEEASATVSKSGGIFSKLKIPFFGAKKAAPVAAEAKS